MNYKSVEETLHTLESDNGEVYIISNGRRKMLAKCKLKIDIIQHSTTFKARNPKGYDVKKRYISVILCIDPETSPNITDEIFNRAERYEICFEVEKDVGVCEKIKLDNLFEESIDLYENEWEFSIEDNEVIKRLMKLC